jgi:hypothetical protein
MSEKTLSGACIVVQAFNKAGVSFGCLKVLHVIYSSNTLNYYIITKFLSLACSFYYQPSNCCSIVSYSQPKIFGYRPIATTSFAWFLKVWSFPTTNNNNKNVDVQKPQVKNLTYYYYATNQQTFPTSFPTQYHTWQRNKATGFWNLTKTTTRRNQPSFFPPNPIYGETIMFVHLEQHLMLLA